MELPHTYEGLIQLKKNELKERKNSAQLLTRFQLNGNIYEVRKMEKINKFGPPSIILGVYDEKGPHIWFDGFWQELEDNKIEFSNKSASNLDITIDEEAERLVKKDGHVANLAAITIGELVSQNIINRWRSSTVQTTGGKKIYEFLQTDDYWRQKVEVNSERVPQVGTRSIVTKRM